LGLHFVFGANWYITTLILGQNTVGGLFCFRLLNMVMFTRSLMNRRDNWTDSLAFFMRILHALHCFMWSSGRYELCLIWRF